MSYLILKHRTKMYSKELIHCGFQVLEKYYSVIFSYCKEAPRLPLRPDEVLSDLIIDRMPRFVENFAGGTTLEVLDICKLDLSAVENQNKYKFNLAILQRRIAESLKAVLSADEKDPKLQDKLDSDLATVREQLIYLKELRRLAKIEKRLLAYMRSCVRRTKIKYLQSRNTTLEGQLTITSDPTNGMMELVSKPDTSVRDLADARELLQSIELMPEDIDLLIDALVFEFGYDIIGERVGVKRTTAAKRYQRAIINFNNKMRKHRELNYKEQTYRE